jgi:hypothetical protein
VYWSDRVHPRQVVDAYRQAIAEAEGASTRRRRTPRRTRPRPRRRPRLSAAASAADETLRWGSRAAEIVAARLLDGGGRETYHLRSGEAASFAIEVRASEPLDDFVFGIAVATPRGVECWGTNTDLAGLRPLRSAAPAPWWCAAPSCGSRPANIWSTSRSTRATAPRTTIVGGCSRSPSPRRSEASALFSGAPVGFEGAIEWEDETS